MASLRKLKNTWQIKYYLDGRRVFKHFSPDTPKAVVMAEKKRIEANIALHKAGIKPFSENNQRVDFITLRDLTEKVIEKKKNDVSDDTLKRNLYAMKVFMEIVGADMPIANLKDDHFDQFKKARYEKAESEYERKVWAFHEDKIKRGVNKDLVNIRAVLRAGANKGMVPYSMVPKSSFTRLIVNGYQISTMIMRSSPLRINSRARLCSLFGSFGTQEQDVARSFVKR